jgi:hypothetical protein
MEIDLTEDQQQDQPAAAVGRQQLADSGQQQLLALLQSSKALLDAYSDIQPTTEFQQKLATLQQAYLAVSQDIRATLQQCQALEQQEAAASAAGVNLHNTFSTASWAAFAIVQVALQHGGPAILPAVLVCVPRMHLLRTVKAAAFCSRSKYGHSSLHAKLSSQATELCEYGHAVLGECRHCSFIRHV